MNFHKSFKKCSIRTPDTTKQPQTSLESIKWQNKIQQWMTSRGSYVHEPMVKLSGASQKFYFLKFSEEKHIDGFRQNDSQGF